MKGRSLHSTSLVALVAACLVAGALAGCAGEDAAAELPAETAAALLPATDSTAAAGAPTSTALATTAPATTLAPATTVTPTAAPTVVETLPVPAAPPAPRADEPYIELGTLEIPALGVVQPLLEGITLNTLDLGPGHWPGTAMPGKLGNVVIAGHRTSHGKVFRDVDRLVAGDEVIFDVADGRFVYVVTEITIVQPDALYIIDQTPERTATLFACHPPGSTRQRIVVHLTLQR